MGREGTGVIRLSKVALIRFALALTDRTQQVRFRAVRGLKTCAGIATALAVLVVSASASAATLNVTKTGDPVPGACTPGDCSLREAVRRANSTGSADKIVLKARTYQLTQVGIDDDAIAGDLDVLAGSGRLTIVAKGAGRTAIDGNDIDSVLQVLEGARASIRELTMRNGAAPVGGVIANAGTLSLSRAAVRQGSALVGGGVNNSGNGRLTVLRSVITSNFADAVGGGINNQDDASATLKRSKVVGNDSNSSAGGIYNSNGGRVTINRTKIAGNEAQVSGGGVYDQSPSPMAIGRSTVTRNRAQYGGGVYVQNDAILSIGRSTIARNTGESAGGGVYVQNEARLSVSRSTIDSNKTVDNGFGPNFSRGGGIYAQGEPVIAVSRSTISRNFSPTMGGGIFVNQETSLGLANTTLSGNRADRGGAIALLDFAKVTLTFSTIARNRATTSAGAIFEDSTNPTPTDPQPPYVTLRGALIARNSAPPVTAGGDNCFIGALVWLSLGGSVEDDNSCQLTAGSDQVNAAAKLRRLARNGGPTKTHALKPSSDAVNAARRRGCPGRDQRGVKRPQRNRCDAGSYELKRRR